MTSSHEQQGNEGGDIFKDSFLRYLGYTNELGESFRPLVHHRVVTASYVVAGGYVIADTADKVQKALVDEKLPKQARYASAIEKGLDTLIWQGLASIVIPGAVINRIVWATGRIRMPPRMKSVVPTVVGLASIPLIIHPIDEGVDLLLDSTTRPMLRRKTQEQYPSDWKD